MFSFSMHDGVVFHNHTAVGAESSKETEKNEEKEKHKNRWWYPEPEP
jgi:hypothetical protein